MNEEQSDQIAKAELAEIESEHYIQYDEFQRSHNGCFGFRKSNKESSNYWQKYCERLWNKALNGKHKDELSR